MNEIQQNMEVGDPLPTEKELINTYEVSRMTVRNAISELENDGIVTKKQGRGTFVNKVRLTQGMGTIFSWTEEMGLQQMVSKTIYQTISLQKPSPQIAADLGITKTEKVITITRVRTIDDEPIVIMVNYLPEILLPGFVESGFKEDSLYSVLEKKYNIFLSRAEETIMARDSTPFEASMLRVPEGSALLHVRRKSYNSKNLPVEVVDMTARGDRYQYFAEIDGRTHSAYGEPRR